MIDPYHQITELQALDILRRWLPEKAMPEALQNRDWYCAVADEDELMEALDGVEQIVTGEWWFTSFFKGDDVPMVSLIGVPCGEPEPVYVQMEMF